MDSTNINLIDEELIPESAPEYQLENLSIEEKKKY